MLGAITAGERGWPGWQALLPVCGTMLVIAARQTRSALTANPVMGWIGLNSYSIYLWAQLQALLIAGRGEVSVPLADDRRSNAAAIAMLRTVAARCWLLLIVRQRRCVQEASVGTDIDNQVDRPAAQVKHGCRRMLVQP